MLQPEVAAGNHYPIPTSAPLALPGRHRPWLCTAASGLTGLFLSPDTPHLWQHLNLKTICHISRFTHKPLLWNNCWTVFTQRKHPSKINRMMKKGFGLIKTKNKFVSLGQCAALRSGSSQSQPVLPSTSARTCPPGWGSPTFKDFCRIPTGKPLVGSVVSQRRKSGWGSVIFSKAFSRWTSHFTRRWQFCNMSHCPWTTAPSSICKAIWGEGENHLWVTLPLPWEQTASDGLVQWVFLLGKWWSKWVW